MARPVINHDLDALLIEAGYDNAHGAFARQVNHVVPGGAARYDAASVYWWLRGRCPDPPIRAAIAQILGRKLNRTVTIDELGFGYNLTAGSAYPDSPELTINTVTELWRLLGHRGDALAAARFDAGAALQAALAWRYDPDDVDLSRPGPRQVNGADVAALRVVATQFSELDRRHGGAAPHGRKLIADFLHRQVAPMLHGSYTDLVGRDLMAAAAGIVGQLAYMAYDSGEHGAAQRHYTIALRLTKAAGDRLFGAHLMANLATQAVYLRHARDAVRLARAAVDGAGRAPAGVRARLHTTEACAHAIAGDRRSCTKALINAQTALDRGARADDPAWAAYFTPAHFAGTAARCFRDLRLPRQALRHGPAALNVAAGSTRTHALHSALLATIHAEAGDLDAACDYAHQAARHSYNIRSRRVRQRLTELSAALQSHRRVPIVCRLFDEHREVLPAT